ncbi:MAG: hypothetical protein II970_02890 [Paludibacteraceae bacterium]|nr:hypothetical protein [Paludibacteraceae bacterium]
MSKVQLTGAFARIRGKLNRSESLVFKGCPCGKEQMAMDLLNPSKAIHPKNIACQEALKTAAQAAKTALSDPSQRASYESEFKTQKKIRSLFAYVVKQLYVKPTF